MYNLYSNIIKLDRQETITKFQELINDFKSKLTKNHNSEKYDDLLSDFNNIDNLFNQLDNLKDKIKKVNYTIEGDLCYYHFIDTESLEIYENPADLDEEFDKFSSLIERNSQHLTNPLDLIRVFESYQTEFNDTLHKVTDPIPQICLTVADRSEFEFLDEFKYLYSRYTKASEELQRLMRIEFLSTPSIKNFKKQAKILETKLENTYEQQNVIDNLLNGHSYVPFKIKRDHDNSQVYLEMKGSFRAIPEFKSNTIYLPFIKGGLVSDYLKYDELKYLSVHSCIENKIFLNVDESIESLEKNPVQSFKRQLKELPSMKTFKENYLEILNFVQKNHKNDYSKKESDLGYFLLNFNFAQKTIFVEHFYNSNPFSNINNVFLVGRSYEEQEKFHHLLKFTVDIVNIEQTLEFMNIFENMKHF